MVIPLPQFTAPSYGDRTLNEVQRCVNLYPEQTPDGWRLLSLPGLELLDSVANNAACRSAYCTTNGVNYSANGTAVYEISTTGADTLIGAITNNAGSIITWADDGTYCVLTTGSEGYYINILAQTITQITDVNFPSTPGSVTYMDGYFIVTSGELFYLSALGDPSDWTPVTFATAEYRGDALIRAIALGSQLYNLGQGSIEPWYNTGNASFPLERVSGGTINVGIRSVGAVATFQDGIFFLGANTDGVGGFFSLVGGQFKRISTPYIESLIASYVSQARAYSFCWHHDGHLFFETTFPTDGRTLVYDVTQGAWFEASSDISGLTHHRVRMIINRSNAVPTLSFPALAFDNQDGKVYKVTTGYNSENGTALTRIRTFGPIQARAMRMTHHRIRFVLEVDHDSSASYTLAPTLDWTDDGGATWSTSRTLSKAITSGTTGQRVMLEAHRLGSSRQRYYRLTFTGPAARIVLQSAELEADVGRH